MAEELRFFLRTAAFTAIIATVYWFLSYEIAGTTLLVALFVGAVLFVATMGKLVTATRSDIIVRDQSFFRRLATAAVRIFGLVETADPARKDPLAIEDAPVAHSSVWPVGAAVAALLAGLGLIFGAWFWVPGIALGASVAWGWITQLR